MVIKVKGAITPMIMLSDGEDDNDDDDKRWCRR
jgi:hypothetical protein